MKSQFSSTFYSASENPHLKATRVLSRQSHDVSKRKLTPIASSGNFKPMIPQFATLETPNRQPSLPSYSISNMRTEISDGQKKIFKNTRVSKKKLIVPHQGMNSDVSKINGYLTYLDSKFQDNEFEAKMQTKSLALNRQLDLEEEKIKSRLEYDQHMPSPLKEIINEGVQTQIDKVKLPQSLPATNKGIKTKLSLIRTISQKGVTLKTTSMTDTTTPAQSTVKRGKQAFDFASEGNKLFESVDPEIVQLAEDLAQNYTLFLKYAAKSKDVLSEMNKFFNSYQVQTVFSGKEGTLQERILKEIKDAQEAHNNLMAMLKKDVRNKNNFCMRYYQFKRVNEHLIEANLKFRVSKLQVVEEIALKGYDTMKLREKVTIGKMRKMHNNRLNDLKGICEKNQSILRFYEDGINVGEMMHKLEYHYGDMEQVQRDTRIINKSLNEIIHNLNYKFWA